MSDPERGPAVNFANMMLLSNASPEDLRLAISRLANFDGHYRGLISELRAKLIVGQIPPVKEIRKGNGHDDSEKIDLWVFFRDGVYPKTPLQVKSNDFAVRQFRKMAQERGLRIMALNCGIEIAEQDIIMDFIHELRTLYDNTHS
jgi:hypothetical protein